MPYVSLRRSFHFRLFIKRSTGRRRVFELNGYRLKAFKVNHNVICYGYTLELDRAGKFQLEKAMAMDIPKMYWSRLQKGETIVDELQGKTYLPEMVMGRTTKRD